MPTPRVYESDRAQSLYKRSEASSASNSAAMYAVAAELAEANHIAAEQLKVDRARNMDIRSSIQVSGKWSQ